MSDTPSLDEIIPTLAEAVAKLREEALAELNADEPDSSGVAASLAFHGAIRHHIAAINALEAAMDAAREEGRSADAERLERHRKATVAGLASLSNLANA